MASNEPMTPSGLRRHLGLTSGAVTACVDRLERAGHIRRVRESADRRVVHLRYEPDARAAARSYFRPLAERDSDEFFADARYGEFWVGARPSIEDVERELGLTARHVDGLVDAVAKDAGELTVRVVRDADRELTDRLGVSERTIRRYAVALHDIGIPVVRQPGVGGGYRLRAGTRLAPPMLSDEEAAEFRDGPSALDEVVRRLKDALGLITFFTAGEKETRAWTLRSGQTALDAAGTIHSDIARGFIRCEVIRWKDLVEAGSHAEASRRGLQRLEGKTYAIRDGDGLNIRFNV